MDYTYGACSSGSCCQYSPFSGDNPTASCGGAGEPSCFPTHKLCTVDCQSARKDLVSNNLDHCLDDSLPRSEKVGCGVVNNCNVEEPNRFPTGRRFLAAQYREAVCFPADARAFLYDGTHRRMNQLAPGDHVAVVLSDGRIAFEPIVDLLHDVLLRHGIKPAFSHYEPDAAPMYVEIQTEAGSKLVLSPEHLLPTVATWRPAVNASQLDVEVTARDDNVSYGASATLRTAASVAVGDIVFVMDAEGLRATPTRVESVSRKVHQGAYNFHTAAGTIIVEGTVASVFTEQSWPLGWGSSLQPLQRLHQWLPYLAKALS